MFNLKVLVLFAVLINCILSMPTADQDMPSEMPSEAPVEGKDPADMATAEHHYRGYWGGYHYPYYHNYYYGRYYHHPGYYYWG